MKCTLMAQHRYKQSKLDINAFDAKRRKNHKIDKNHSFQQTCTVSRYVKITTSILNVKNITAFAVAACHFITLLS